MRSQSVDKRNFAFCEIPFCVAVKSYTKALPTGELPRKRVRGLFYSQNPLRQPAAATSPEGRGCIVANKLQKQSYFQCER